MVGRNNFPIAVGTKIWRGIAAHVNGPYLQKFICIPARRGGFMFRANVGAGHFTEQPVAMGEPCTFGLVCFISKPPSGPWTHFEVTRVHKGGGSVEVRVVYGRPDELYAQYSIGNCVGLIPYSYEPDDGPSETLAEVLEEMRGEPPSSAFDDIIQGGNYEHG